MTRSFELQIFDGGVLGDDVEDSDKWMQRERRIFIRLRLLIPHPNGELLPSRGSMHALVSRS
jgi:hypothetical protein